MVAMTVVIASVAATIPNVVGSSGDTPYSSPSNTRVSSSAPPRPSTSPTRPTLASRAGSTPAARAVTRQRRCGHQTRVCAAPQRERCAGGLRRAPRARQSPRVGSRRARAAVPRRWPGRTFLNSIAASTQPSQRPRVQESRLEFDAVDPLRDLDEVGNVLQRRAHVPDVKCNRICRPDISPSVAMAHDSDSFS